MSFSFLDEQSSNQNFPKELWNIFHLFTRTPRPSKKEAKIRKLILDLAQEHDYKCKVDACGNIVVYVPASEEFKNKDTLIIQNHIDMVTDAAPGVEINFDEDPIETIYGSGWLKAKGTTLGADNGIGCAAALALMGANVKRPPLELLFTVDEETGLTGAMELDGSLLSGKKILNLDTEEWGSLYVGCAGGIDYEFFGSINREKLNGNEFEIKIKSFAGGHSGVDIHRDRANAIKYLGLVFDEILNDDVRLISLNGGKAHNIIPRDVSCSICTNKSIEELKDKIKSCTENWKSYLAKEDQNFELEIVSKQEHIDCEVLTAAEQRRVLALLNLFPHGVNSIVRESDELLVGTSNNLAKMIVLNEHIYIQTSLRFFDRKEIIELEKKMNYLAEFFGLRLQKNSEYPSWKPNFQSSILKRAQNIYKESFNKEAEIKAIHAGLECGILMDRIPGVEEALSFGPTIINAHSPDESVNVESVTEFWKFLKKIIVEI
jgi:dipeptidase D